MAGISLNDHGVIEAGTGVAARFKVTNAARTANYGQCSDSGVWTLGSAGGSGFSASHVIEGPGTGSDFALTVKVNKATAYGLAIWSTTAPTTGYPMLSILDNGATQIFRVDSGGKCYVGPANSVNINLDINGSIEFGKSSSFTGAETATIICKEASTSLMEMKWNPSGNTMEIRNFIAGSTKFYISNTTEVGSYGSTRAWTFGGAVTTLAASPAHYFNGQLNLNTTDSTQLHFRQSLTSRASVVYDSTVGALASSETMLVPLFSPCFKVGLFRSGQQEQLTGIELTRF